MRGIDWLFILLIILGVPISYVSVKTYIKYVRKDIFLLMPMFGVIFGIGGCFIRQLWLFLYYRMGLF